jgi:hypothetical protein
MQGSKYFLFFYLVIADWGEGMQQPQRETTTDSLASIIQILQLGYRSGTLTVERTIGGGIEEGYAVFASGQVVTAQANRYIGVSAFNYLKGWGTCRFSFLEGAASGPLLSPPVPPPRETGPGGPTTPPPFRRFSIDSGPLENGDMGNRERSTGPLFPNRSSAGEAVLYGSGISQLSRQQRRLLLLTNGQRGPDELARLMARTADEVRVLLDELERVGLILQ